MNNKEIIDSIIKEFDNTDTTFVSRESLPIENIENHIQLYEELTDIFNDVTFNKKGNLLNISIYKTLQKAN